MKRPVLKLKQMSVQVMGPEKNTIDDSNGPLSLNSYQISHCEMSELTQGFDT